MAGEPLAATTYGEHVAWLADELGYEPYEPEGYPVAGGTGRLNDVNPRLTIRTLNRLSPGDDPTAGKFLRKCAVWMYAGHGAMARQADGYPYNMSYLQFMIPGEWDKPDRERTGIWAGYELAEKQRYSIDKFDLNHVRLAYLMACFSAGGSERKDDGTVWTVAHNDSVAAHFKSRGAKAVIGFRQRVHAYLNSGWSDPKPSDRPYMRFHETFWGAVCKGTTVYKAYRDAWDEIRDTWNTEYPDSAVYPVLFGGKGIKITPSR